MSHSREITIQNTQNGDLPDQDDSRKVVTKDDIQAENTEAPEPKEEGGDATEEETEEPLRRSQRPRVLSEKGKQLQEAKLKDLLKTFDRMYKRWKYHINGLKRAIKGQEDSDFIVEIIAAINVQQNDLNTTYERIRAISVPDHELRRRNDCCCAITKAAREKALCFISATGNPDDIPWPEADSVFDPTESSVRSLRLCPTSRVSSRVSIKPTQEKQQQAAAEVAATHEVLKIMKTQHECEEEIRELEAEEKKITAQREAKEREMEAERARETAVFVTESAARKRKLEEKKKEVERLEELKRHNAAQARLKIYTEEDLQEHAASVPQHTQSIHATVGTTWDPAAYSSVPLQAQLKKPSFTLLPPVVQVQDQPTSVLQHIPNSHDIVGSTLKPAAYSFVPLPAPLSRPSFTLPPPVARLQDHLSSAPQLIQSAHATAGTMLDPAARSFVPVQVPASWPSATLPPPMALSHGHSIETAAPACTAVPQVDMQATSADSTNDLVRMLADAIAANRIPIPEPAIFFGNPLQYTDWKMSFNTLIHRKNLPAQEKLFFLRKYVGGEAKRAVEGYSLVGTEDAYTAAWSMLDDRFGNPFVIGKAYRDKIQSWHKISSRDGKDLREFADFLTSVTTAMSHTQGLQTLNDCVEIQKIAAKLPDWLSSRWNRTATLFQYEHKVFPDFKLFVTFLNTEARIACNPITSFQALKESEQENYRPSDSDHKLHRYRNASAKTLSTSSSEKTSYVCKFCKWSGHSLNKCRKFMEMPVEDRVKFVQLEKLCFGCLKVGHSSKACAARSVCERCEKRHPTCLHQDRERSTTSQSHQLQQAVSGEPAESKHEQPNEHVEVQQATSNRVIQQDRNTHTSSILPVYVSSTANPEEEILVYALLDTQSDTTFILKDVADLLHVERDPVRLKISTITSRSMVVSSSKMRGLQVRGLMSDERINLPITYTREYIPANKSDIPTCKTARGWPHLEHLADKMPPELDCEVGLLIGYNCPQVLLPRGVVSGKEGQPFAQKSVLGWSIIGYSNLDNDLADDIGISHRVISREITPTPEPLKSEVHFVYRTKVKEMLTPADILKIFESDFTESSGEDGVLSQEDLRFLAKLKEGIKQKDDGHFEMPLPFKQDKPALPSNVACAEHRLQCLKRRFRKDEQYCKDYRAFMTDIIARGDAEKVPNEEISKQPAWYIPHHGVYHPQKPGKIRVVFDCSARFKGICLNEHLLTGPDLTNTLIGVLCRFRKGQVAIMCDVERMFHQFHVAKEDQDYLRFLWWEGDELEAQPSVFRMRVHLFGAASSPGCANFGLKHLATQGEGKFSQAAARFVQRNFYVDDGLTSVESDEEAVQLVKDARDLCKSGNLHLHKFVSNSKQVIASLPREECAESAADLDFDLGQAKVERALGVQWCVSSDTFQFRVTVKENPFTRRGVLSTVASVFDPLGFVAPFILTGKKILQTMCRDKVGWDEPLTEELKPCWELWLRDLQDLATVKISRCYVPPACKDVLSYELHNFADASVFGYGVCSYLRTVMKNREVHCSLVMGKARVAPTKVTTIPRLELSAAVVASRIGDLLQRELELDELSQFYWTDSKVVLGYINNDARRFQVFVANRIQQIKSSTEPCQWRYVATEHNPADHASRGLTANELLKSNWFTGPNFLWQRDLPEEEIKGEVCVDDPELRRAQVLTTKATEQTPLLSRLQKFSDWGRMIKATARLKRLARTLKGLKESSELTTLDERKDAELFIIRLVQEDVFCTEIKALKEKQEVTSTQAFRLHKLHPFVDKHNILRVGGRLTKATLHSDVKQPAILPKGHHVSRLLIKHFHEQICHQGRGMTMNEIRSKGFWILGCSSEVSSIIYLCLKCRKYRKSTQEQVMADLPPERLAATPPFTYSGMDCFGPFYVKEGRKELKRYGLLFTCMCSRAVHIEALTDLSSDSFLNALRCFISIRGNVRQLHSDQGTNFVGAKREFQELMKGSTEERMKELGCSFIFNPPSSSHMGGVWERQIRTVRSVLTAILDQSGRALDSSSLRTFMYEAMAIVNSRPLTSENLNDPLAPEPLTPNHILTMKSEIIAPPPGEFSREDLYLRKRWRRVQYLANEFWRRWRKEYVLNLQQREKWYKNRRNTKVNDIVLLQDDLAPRNHWKLAKVVEVFPGSDGRVRKIKLLVSDATLNDKGVRTTKPVYLERPIHKIVSLLESE